VGSPIGVGVPVSAFLSALLWVENALGVRVFTQQPNGAPPLPSRLRFGDDFAISAAQNGGTDVVSVALAVTPSTGNGQGSLVFRPGATTAAPVYGTWSPLWSAATAVDNAVLGIDLDGSSNANVCLVPAGTYSRNSQLDFQGVTWTGGAGSPTTLAFADGAKLTAPRMTFTDLGVGGAATSNANVPVAPNGSDPVLVFRRCTITSTTAYPTIDLRGKTGTIFLEENTTFGDGTSPVLLVDGTSNVYVIADGTSLVKENFVSGPAANFNVYPDIGSHVGLVQTHLTSGAMTASNIKSRAEIPVQIQPTVGSSGTYQSTTPTRPGVLMRATVVVLSPSDVATGHHLGSAGTPDLFGLDGAVLTVKGPVDLPSPLVTFDGDGAGAYSQIVYTPAGGATTGTISVTVEIIPEVNP